MSALPAKSGTLPIGAIKLGTRFRADLGDISGLSRSIERVGMLHPIVINQDGVLIAGRRRLEAAKLLRWNRIPAVKIDLKRIADGEAAENFDRKDFNPIEAVAIKRALEPEARAEAERRMKAGKPGGNLPQGQAGKSRDQVAKFTNFGARTLDKAAAVLDAATSEPDVYGGLVDLIKKTGKVNSAYRRLRQQRDEKRVLGLRPIEGKFRTLIADPPWDYEWLSLAGRAAPGYATLTHDQLLAMTGQFSAWSEENAHMYLWTTNNFMTRAVELMARWGFSHKTVLTWVKPRWGLGSYFRNSTEHVLFGVRGELSTRRDDIATHFEAPVGEHSEKPERFYEIVRAASYPPYGEAFQRARRADFADLWTIEAAEAA